MRDAKPCFACRVRGARPSSRRAKILALEPAWCAGTLRRVPSSSPSRFPRVRVLVPALLLAALGVLAAGPSSADPPTVPRADRAAPPSLKANLGFARIVVDSQWTPALKAELRRRARAAGGGSAPGPSPGGNVEIARPPPARFTPAEPRTSRGQVLGFNLAETSPDYFAWRVPTASEEGFSVELRLAALTAGATYFVDCALAHRGARNRSPTSPPMPTFVVSRNGNTLVDAPSGMSRDDIPFHFVTSFVAIAGENVVRLGSRSDAAGRAVEWRSEWRACEIELLS